MKSLNNNDTPFEIKVKIYGDDTFHLFLLLLLLDFLSWRNIKRASRKCRRKTLLYISGSGMVIFIFIAAMLVKKMEGFSSTRSFLSSKGLFETRAGTSDDEGYDEVYLLISIL